MSVNDAWVVENLNAIRPVNLKEICSQYKHLESIPFPEHIGQEVEVLIGADVPEALLHLEYIKGPSREDPIAVRTLYGWALFGGKNVSFHKEINHLSFEKLEESVERFWKQETYGTTSKLSPQLLTKDEKLAIAILERTTSKKNGKFEVGMLWKNNTQLPNNRLLAFNRLISTEKRLN